MHMSKLDKKNFTFTSLNSILLYYGSATAYSIASSRGHRANAVCTHQMASLFDVT